MARLHRVVARKAGQVALVPTVAVAIAIEDVHGLERLPSLVRRMLLLLLLPEVLAPDTATQTHVDRVLVSRCVVRPMGVNGLIHAIGLLQDNVGGVLAVGLHLDVPQRRQSCSRAALYPLRVVVVKVVRMAGPILSAFATLNVLQASQRLSPGRSPVATIVYVVVSCRLFLGCLVEHLGESCLQGLQRASIVILFRGWLHFLDRLACSFDHA